MTEPLHRCRDCVHEAVEAALDVSFLEEAGAPPDSPALIESTAAADTWTTIAALHGGLGDDDPPIASPLFDPEVE